MRYTMTKKILLLAAVLTLLFTACSQNTDVTMETTVTAPDDEITPLTTLTTNAAALPEIPISEPVETARISFLAAGDNVIHPCIYIDARNRATTETREYNFKPMYADVCDYIASFDLAFINQETLMCGNSFGLSGYPHFNSPQALGYDLLDIGFDIVSIANNHMCDKGASGLVSTIDFWESEEMSDILMIGGYRDREDYDKIRTIERDGVKIAFLAYTYDTNGLRLPISSELVVPYINDNDIIRQCELAENAADLVFVSIHWGEENISTPTNEQKRIARLLADNGADVIIGHHPHVLQPIEWIETDHGETLCIYSLGNLLSAMQYWQNMVGGFLTFDIVAMSDGQLTIESPEFIPTAFFYGPSYYNSTIYLMEDFTEELAKSHGTKVYGYQVSFDTLKSYVFKNIDESFLS